nr:MAG TPA: hypothetical protein [Caudoviricetes sp.]
MLLRTDNDSPISYLSFYIQISGRIQTYCA